MVSLTWWVSVNVNDIGLGRQRSISVYWQTRLYTRSAAILMTSRRLTCSFWNLRLFWNLKSWVNGSLRRIEVLFFLLNVISSQLDDITRNSRLQPGIRLRNVTSFKLKSILAWFWKKMLTTRWVRELYVKHTEWFGRKLHGWKVPTKTAVKCNKYIQLSRAARKLGASDLVNCQMANALLRTGQEINIKFTSILHSQICYFFIFHGFCFISLALSLTETA